jgi:hypothetical protein
MRALVAHIVSSTTQCMTLWPKRDAFRSSTSGTIAFGSTAGRDKKLEHTT